MKKSSCNEKTHANECSASLNENDGLPIVVIGAGPVGLAAAAHLSIRNERFIILESGPQAGANIETWCHIRLFSPWRYNLDKAAVRLLNEERWKEPDLESLPTGGEFIEQYLKPLSNTSAIRPNLELNSKVLSISKKRLDKMKTKDRVQSPFILYVERNGIVSTLQAKAVIDATGTWGNPNPANSDGVWLPGEKEGKESIFYGMPDINGKEVKRYMNNYVAVVGSGHSAINALLELAELQKLHSKTSILWIMRKERVEHAYGGEESDSLAARGELGKRIHQLVDDKKILVETAFQIEQMKITEDGKVLITGDKHGQRKTIQMVDEIIVNTGNRPDFSFLREVRIQIDHATESVQDLAPLIDPNVHSCGTVRPHGEKELRQPEENFYIVGAKSYGRAPTFLMATGYEQVRSVIAHMAGDFEAASKVELNLPETGVCSVNFTAKSSCDENLISSFSSQNSSCCS